MFARLVASSSRAAVRSYSTPAAADTAAAPFLLPTHRPGYFIERTANGQLPVYSDIKNGGNNTRTIVRRVKGDVGKLRNDLAQYLADGHIDPLRPPPAVTIRPTSRQVEVRGRWVEEIKSYLSMRGF